MFSKPRYAVALVLTMIATLVAAPLWTTGPLSGAVGPAVVVPADTLARMSANLLSRRTSDKPTIVLVHGAFADASSWSTVTDQLQRTGYPVVAVANPLQGLADDAARLASTLATIDGPIALVGHSYGGAVISQAAAGNPHVEALVFIAALIPDIGEEISTLAARSTQSELAASLVSTPYTKADGSEGTQLTVDQAKFHSVFAADIPVDQARVLAAAQRPIDASAFTSTPTAAAWRTIPSWSLIARQDLALGADLERFEADRAGSHTVEIDSSHAAMLSHADSVTAVIVEAATSTR